MPLTDEQTRNLQAAFRPHAPIEESDAFQGRTQELARVSDAVSSPGLHVVIYGERGAGKTSLANVATASHRRVRLFCQKTSTFNLLMRDILVEYGRAHEQRIVFDTQHRTVRLENRILATDSLSGNDLRSFLPERDPLCIVLDELDRVEDVDVAAQIAELCKNLSTYQTNVTMVLIGVAETADLLLKGHASNIRNLRQVSLERMSTQELKAILRHGENVLRIRFETNTERRILSISDQYPYYLHLIAKNSAHSALNRGSVEVTAQDLNTGIKLAAQDCQESLRDAYDTAILSVKSSPIYRQIVWALASVNNVATVSAIADAVNKIAAREHRRSVSTQSVGQALKRLISPEKKEIISTKTQGFYGFTNPLMRGYVRLVRESDNAS